MVRMSASADSTRPSNDAPIHLNQSVDSLPGVGSTTARRLGRLGIATVADLVRHLPFRYEYHRGMSTIGDLALDTTATVVGEVANCRCVGGRGGRFNRRGGRFQATLCDQTHSLDLTWFNGRYLQGQIRPGMTLQVTGKVTAYNDYRQMVNPKWKAITPDGDDQPQADPNDDQPRYRPIYPATEDLTSEQIERIIADVLDEAVSQIPDHLNAEFRSDRALPQLAAAYQTIHQPPDEDAVATARRRLAYDELLMLQLGLSVKRYHARHELTAPALRISDAIDQHIRHRFPFELTEAQNQVIGQIVADLQRTEPMNRLLQGDVGSGKTVVALYAMLLGVAANKQAALMAPTELLAEQHYLSIGDMLAGSNVRIALLTGSANPADRQATAQAIERGEIDLVIGTQALLTESVRFNDLAVVVVDEQHRFGVMQRARIRSKTAGASTAPHYLVMTATPIPRTLSLTLFGDLDVSTIRGLPPGRQPIATRVVGPEKSDQVYQYLAQRLADGEQAYVVLPAIEQNATNLKAVRSHARHLAETHFAGLRLATIHGQLKTATREQIMHRFRAGRIDVLIATTVIEVGVDVPNASLMVVEHAERFGLAQLHQLRGRVGRGSRKSLCVFIAEPTTDDARQRMEAIGQTTDGFEIAEADLLIRGMGQIIGTQQSGLPPLRVAQIPDDMELLQMARRDARQLVEADPKLAKAEHELMRKRLVKQYGQYLELGDVG